MPSQPFNSNVTLCNHLLASLPQEGYKRLQPHLSWVDLSLGSVLHDVGEPVSDIYFPVQSLVSLISVIGPNTQVEFRLVGNEGLVGLAALLGGEQALSKSIVQVAGKAVKVNAQALKQEFTRGEAFQKQVLLYLQLALAETAQNVSCQVYHQVEPRFARWLLSIQDRLQTDELPLTQKYAAMLLGTRRATITEAAGHLQRAGMIQYQRGKITICDRAALEKAACNCYVLLRDESERLQAISRSIH
ncbi:Crp/Fnr family transcriptional regulator [Oscillatoria sp. CS-180]|uniref:Crp/Fnr family transcriptional regulator n=1 Tax=Oscillatoria sp. CS-180 TaxID=3021720 RepID=UPI00232F4EB6|nr:Crp/Fnr family transcriptional regulator [Oscillatoria sp. CS-180]MDB9529115.1 Crp/Fnr family transcriptional regulator [Oscillatoria sp. CS-180]